MSRRVALILLIIILLGVSLRAYQLTARSLWFDEAFSWRLIQFSLPEMIARDAQDVHPPLYYIVLKWWSVVFGSSLPSLRGFSVAMAAATIALSYLFTAEATRSRGAGLLTAMLIAFSGFQIQYAWEARMYTLGTAAILLSSWLLIKALRAHPPRFSWWLAYSLATVAFAYIHYYSFFSIAAQMIFLFGYIIVTNGGRIGEILQSRITWYVLLAYLVMLGIYAPWISTFMAQNAQVQQSYWIPEIGGWSIPDTFYRMFAPTRSIPRHDGIGWILLAAAPITLTGIGLLILAMTASRRRLNQLLGLMVKKERVSAQDSTWYVISAALVPFLLSIILSILGQSLYDDRFFVFTHIFIIVALSLLLYRIPWRLLRYLLSIGVLAGFVVANINYWQELDILNKPGSHAAAKYVLLMRQKSEPIIVSSPFAYFSILHYAQEEYKDDSPKLYSINGERSHFAGGPILTSQDIVGPEIFIQSTANVIWVINTSGFGEKPLVPPDNWLAVQSVSFSEVHSYQGDVSAIKYKRI